MQPSLPAARRAILTALFGLAVLLFTAGPAAAHVEATVSPGAQAGNGPVTVTFSAEAERSNAGITGVATQLPQGVLPEWATLASGPDGWALTPTADGFEITGPALPAGTDAEYAVTIGQLPPDLTELVFPTIVRYTDGSEDAWIEVPTGDGAQPASPAPAVTVAAAAATPASTSSKAPAPAAAPSDSTADAPAGSGSNTAAIVTVVVLMLAVVAGGVWFWRARAARR